MNYEDEDYVRFYTRDTVSWIGLGWEGQCVLSLMLHGKFDRSGVFDCDGHDPSHAVTLVTRVPAEIAAAGLARLLESGTWVLRDGRIVWPKFVEAQTCRRSDKARQRESREKRRSDALGTSGDIPSQPVTKPPQPVTPGDEKSQPVTPSRAEQSRAEIPLPLSGGDDTETTVVRRRPDPMGDSLRGNSPEQRKDVHEAHEAFKLATGQPNLKFRAPFDEGAKLIATSIDVDGIDNTMTVARNCMRDATVNGTGEDKQKHITAEYVFKKTTFHRILKIAIEGGHTGAPRKKPNAIDAVRALKDMA